MNIKRIIAVIIATFMVISVLSACSLVGGSSIPCQVDEEGKFIYAVVRPFDSNVTEETGAKDIRTAIKENFEVGVTILRDSVVEDFDGNYEILIGDTNREESAEFKQKLMDNRANNAFDFIVGAKGDKVVIQATTESSLGIAAEWFVKTFCQSTDTWGMLYDGYEFIYEHQTAAGTNVNMVDNENLGNFTVVLPVTTSYLTGMYAEEFVDFYNTFGFEVKAIEDMDKSNPNTIPVLGGARLAIEHTDNFGEFVTYFPHVVHSAKFFGWVGGASSALRSFCHLCLVDPMLVEAYLGMTFEKLCEEV